MLEIFDYFFYTENYLQIKTKTEGLQEFKLRAYQKKFIDFIREQGVVGLAVGFLLGGAISKMVTSFVTDIVNPLVGLLTGVVGNLKDASFHVLNASIMYGSFLSSIIDFTIVALIVYFGVKGLGLDRLDKKK